MSDKVVPKSCMVCGHGLFSLNDLGNFVCDLCDSEVCEVE